jgi:hypothetical protein
LCSKLHEYSDVTYINIEVRVLAAWKAPEATSAQAASLCLARELRVRANQKYGKKGGRGSGCIVRERKEKKGG